MIQAQFTISGATVTAGHILEVTVTHPTISKRVVSYVCLGSEANSAAVATAVASALSNDTGLGAKGITASASGGTVTLKFPYLVNGDVHPTITTVSVAGPTLSVSGAITAAT
ncbi:MAG TPA: hypothetical protein VKZ50_04485 [bacterium]|nr:hypothetical protein [bacterium]